MTAAVHAIRACFLESFGARTRGLLGRDPPQPGEAVWITPCRQVHSLGMRFPIDTVHLDREGRVLATQTLQPWRVGQYFFSAAGVAEMRAGEIDRLGLRVGHRVNLIRIETTCKRR
jgi:hypothetical protein